MIEHQLVINYICHAEYLHDKIDVLQYLKTANNSNLRFSQFYFRGSLVITPCVLSVLRLFYEILRIKISWMAS